MASQIRTVNAVEHKRTVPRHVDQRHAQLGAVILGLTLLGAKAIHIRFFP